jgi:NAD(P)-dependent dehydrogenase (short-subunit alcohol dehydrogenase family)
MLFNGEVALITGGAQGIGQAIATAFCEEGAVSVILDINDEKGQALADSLTEAGYTASYVRCDVTCVADIEKAVAEALSAYGHIDILVNNAGILHGTPIVDISEAEWDKIMDVNLKGMFFMSQKAIIEFKKNGGGKIVNISSLAGRMGGYANGLGYTATKAAMIGLTYGMARRVAGDNINVNAIAPGTTKTDILKALDPDRIEQLRQSVPLKRLGDPEDIANAVVFLASEKAGWITGAILDVNGGMFMG